MSIFTILFVILLIAWVLGISVFHVAGGFIHILLLLAVVALIMHFVRGTNQRSVTAVLSCSCLVRNPISSVN